MQPGPLQQKHMDGIRPTAMQSELRQAVQRPPTHQSGQAVTRPWSVAGGPDRGSGTILVLSLVAVAALLMTVTLGLGAAIAARHRAAAAADLAALAAIDSAEGCPTAGRIALANGGRLISCDLRSDGSTLVTVSVEVPGLPQAVLGSARAGPGPAQMQSTAEPSTTPTERNTGASQ